MVMGRPRKWKDPEKKQQAIMLNKTVLNKLKAYAVETDQSLDDVIKGPFERFENELLELSREIDKIRQDAIMTMRPIEPIQEPLQIVPIVE